MQKSLRKRVEQSTFLRLLLILWAGVGLLSHLTFYTWPLTARLIPVVVERLRLPSAGIFILYALLEIVQLILFYLLTHRQRQEADRDDRPRDPADVRRLRLSLSFNVWAALLLFAFTTARLLAEPLWQFLIVAMSLMHLIFGTLYFYQKAKRRRH